MRIALAAYMDFTGPGPIHMYQFAIELARRGHEPLVLVYGDPASAELMAEPPTFPIHAISFHELFLSRGTIDVLAKHRPEILHLWTPRNVTARLGIECAVRFGTKLVVHFEDAEDYLIKFHGLEKVDTFEGLLACMRDPGSWSWKLPGISALVCKYAFAFTAISKNLQHRMQREWGKVAHLLYPGIDLNQFSPKAVVAEALKDLPRSVRLLVYSGSIGAMHEFDSVLRAVKLVLEQIPEVLLLHLGRNLITEQTDSLVAELQLHDHVEFLGPIAHKAVPGHLAAAEILVQGGSPGEFNRYRLPSKLPEYLAMGKPIVTFAEGFGAELIDGVEALKTYSGSPEELAHCIARVLTDSGLAARLGIAARAKAMALFDWRKNADGLEKLYETVLQARKPISLYMTQRNLFDFDLMTRPKPMSNRMCPDVIKKVLIITPELLPFPGCITSGAGLRAFSLGESLRAHGFEVVYSVPATALKDASRIPPDVAANAFIPPDPSSVIHRVNPDAVVFCHWPVLAGAIEDIPTPVILDLAGPHLLERIYMGNQDIAASVREKLTALNRADFILCAGWRQHAYFVPWLLAAGWESSQLKLPVMPISVGPEQPQHRTCDQPVIAYSGIFLPWQNPGGLLELLVETIAAKAGAKVAFFGGPHPLHRVPGGAVAGLDSWLQSQAAVDYHPLAPYDELIDHLLGCRAAFDVLLPNPEREIAFNVRTVMYLWCGLPVIYNNYAELSGLIAEYEAGWIVDPLDREHIAAVISSIITDPAEAMRRGANAQRLAAEKLTWTKTVEPLVEFLRHPHLSEQRPLEHLAFAAEAQVLAWLQNRQSLQPPSSEQDLASPLDRFYCTENERLQQLLTQREEELRLTKIHAYNLEQFRQKITGTAPYRCYSIAKKLLQRGKS